MTIAVIYKAYRILTKVTWIDEEKLSCVIICSPLLALIIGTRTIQMASRSTVIFVRGEMYGRCHICNHAVCL